MDQSVTETMSVPAAAPEAQTRASRAAAGAAASASSSHRVRSLGLLLTVVAAGFAVTALALLLLAAVSDQPVSWPAVAAFVVMALVTVAVTAVIGWIVLAAPQAVAAPPAPSAPAPPAPAPSAPMTRAPRADPAGDSAEAEFETQRRLLDDVRHELKTPITIVRGHLELMDPADPDDAAATRALGIAELDRMTRLIGDIDLLAAVEAEHFSMGDIELSALTQRAWELVAVIPGHDWSIEQTAEGVIRGDRDRLLQAWLQLAENAAKYTPEGTPIELGSSVHPSGAQLWVRDHGSGIPPAMRHRIFRRFDRGAGKRTVGGSGLGLAIVDAITKAHGGRCLVADTAGGGATFTVEIPIGTRASLPTPVRAGDVVLQREASG
ncbi:sensor histidine kinase [Microbacterium sp.]|uniref:sensor histidine kinase n=1 Tax=Microbacterium sp. TaxID=51671 RepID=UPI0039E696B9